MGTVVGHEIHFQEEMRLSKKGKKTYILVFFPRKVFSDKHHCISKREKLNFSTDSGKF